MIGLTSSTFHKSFAYRLYLSPQVYLKPGRHPGERVEGSKLCHLIRVDQGEGFHGCHFPNSMRFLDLCWATPETHVAIETDLDVIPLSPLFDNETSYEAWLDSAEEADVQVVNRLKLMGITVDSRRGTAILFKLRSESFVEQRSSNHLRPRSVIEIPDHLSFAGRRV